MTDDVFRLCRDASLKHRRKKMATFFNQATLNFGSNSLNSNITVGEIEAGLSMTKTSASADYGNGDGITYIVSTVNSGAADVTGVAVTDNLGTYTPEGSATTVVPLTYVDGSILYYRNGTLAETPTVTAGNTLVVSGITVPAGGNATLVYEARANAFAPLTAGSSITNTASLTGTEPLSDSSTVPVREEPNLMISKALSPAVVTDGGEITYTFVIQNTGNVAIDAADNLNVTDTFNPILSGIEVTLNGSTLAEGTGYTYDEATGAFATVNGAITVPAATYTRDAATGVVTVNPGFAVLVVTGTV